MEFNLVTCNSCGEELPDEHRGPCPDCGNSILNLGMGFNGQSLELNDRGIVMKYQESKGWQPQWHEMRARLNTLKKHYAPGNYQGERQVVQDVRTFFECCFHVADYIGEDPTNNLKTRQVINFTRSDPDLRICEGLANTSKHSVRSNPAWLTAWVDGVTKRSDDSADAVIAWRNDKESDEEDALDLAKRCYQAWRKYHKTHGLKTMPRKPSQLPGTL